MKKQLSLYRSDRRIEMLAEALDVRIEYGSDDGWLYKNACVVGKKKRVKKFVRIARKNFLAKDTKPRKVSSPIAMYLRDGFRADYLVSDIMKECKTDGKNVSNGPGVLARARDSEADRVPLDKDRAAGRSDGYLPDADTGRSAKPGKIQTKDSPVEKFFYSTEKEAEDASSTLNENLKEPPIYEQPTEELTFTQFATRYNVPTATVTSWVYRENGPLSTVYYRDPEQDLFKFERKISPKHLYPYKDRSAGKYAKWQWLEWDEYVQKREDWSSWNAWMK